MTSLKLIALYLMCVYHTLNRTSTRMPLLDLSSLPQDWGTIIKVSIRQASEYTWLFIPCLLHSAMFKNYLGSMEMLYYVNH